MVPSKRAAANADRPARSATGTSAVRRKITTWRLTLRRARFEAARDDGVTLPVAVTVHPDGVAIAHFAGGRDLWFCDLAHLLLAHALVLGDFEEQAPADDGVDPEPGDDVG